MMHTTTALRLIFGAWMLVNGANHFFGFAPEAAGQTPLAVQLMGAFNHSGLMDVAMAAQLVAGALVLAGLFVPVALAVLMPISTCAVYWVLMLERDPIGAILVLAAFALNGLLMLAYLEYYKPMLERRALAVGEAP
jgi:uncharacterized membrane protein YphA (DoxX/SURF4 family)